MPVHAPTPPFPSIDISQLPGITFVTGTWVDGPHVQLAPGVRLSPEEKAAIATATVRYVEAHPSASSVQDLCDRIAQSVQLQRPGDGVRRAPIRVHVQLTDRPTVEILGRTVMIHDALVTGEATFEEKLVPFEATCYLADENGSPFAATAIVTIETGLLGLTVTRDGRELRAYSIPTAVRGARPLRAQIG